MPRIIRTLLIATGACVLATVLVIYIGEHELVHAMKMITPQYVLLYALALLLHWSANKDKDGVNTRNHKILTGK
jgi:hypothetical protein